MAIRTGTHVRQVVNVIEGTVAEKRFDDVTDQFQYLVQWSDADGNPQSKWFLEDQIAEAK